MASDGICPDPSKTDTIRSFLQPQNVSDVRRFLGMENQSGKFSSDVSTLSQPLREVLSKGRAWTWDHLQQTAFATIKSALCQDSCLLLYDLLRETKLSANASSYGVGALLFQRTSPDQPWRPVSCASRSLTPVEKNYAQIEKEALALTWGASCFETYLLGMPLFLIETDHKPLVPLLSTKRLHDLPARILRFRLRLARFNFQIIHVPGSYLSSSDALSRAPTAEASIDDLDLHDDAELFSVSAISAASDSTILTQRVRNTQLANAVCQELVQIIAAGRPKSLQDTPMQLRDFWSVRAEVVINQGLIMRGPLLLIPVAMQPDILGQLHDDHQGVTRTTHLTSSCAWFPGIAVSIKSLIQDCGQCKQFRRPLTEAMVSFGTPP